MRLKVIDITLPGSTAVLNGEQYEFSVAGLYRIRIEHSSATDYAYLQNRQLGWVSDDQCYYEIRHQSGDVDFRRYLDGQN